MTTFLKRVWAALEAYGNQRAEAHLRQLAATYSDPRLKRLLLETANERK